MYEIQLIWLGRRSGMIDVEYTTKDWRAAQWAFQRIVNSWYGGNVPLVIKLVHVSDDRLTWKMIYSFEVGAVAPFANMLNYPDYGSGLLQQGV